VPYEVTSSDVTIEVYRDGPLAELGHNHVIGSSGLTGWVAIAEPLAGSSFVLVLPVAGLTVDEPARLAAAGPQFPDRLSPEDKEATRRNMLSAALLDADRFSLIRLESAAIEGSGGSSLVARTRATVAGRVREIEVPVTFGFDGASLHASGEMTLSHQELGLVPFSAVMGALRVGEELHVSWRIEAQPVAGGELRPPRGPGPAAYNCRSRREALDDRCPVPQSGEAPLRGALGDGGGRERARGDAAGAARTRR